MTVATIAGIPNSFGDTLMSSWMMFPCFAQQAQDCLTTANGACPNQTSAANPIPFESQGLTYDQTFTLGGTPGTMYNMTIRVNGITEGKYYSGGTRHGGNTSPPNPDLVTGIDMFYTGGIPVDVENYNIYKLTVLNTAGTEIQHYYLNSMPTGTGTNYENHDTFPEGYTVTIPVMGGGKITYHQADRNCHAIDNCGIGSMNAGCAITAGRMLPNEATTPIPTTYIGIPMANFNTRNQASQPFHSQAMHITVTAVAPM